MAVASSPNRPEAIDNREVVKMIEQKVSGKAAELPFGCGYRKTLRGKAA
jgi:hypothetical protein